MSKTTATIYRETDDGEVEIKVSGHIYPAEPEVGMATGGVEDIEVLSPEGLELTEDEREAAEEALAEAAADEDADCDEDDYRELASERDCY